MNVGKGWGGPIRPPSGNFEDVEDFEDFEDVNGEGGAG